jgi:hypothetical protein
MKKHFSIKNFCTKAELESVLEYYSALDYAEEQSNKRARRKNMDYHDPDILIMRDIIEPKLEKYFPGSFVSAATFTNWIEHVEIHTDSWQPDENKNKKLGYALLIPLKIEPEHIETSTIVFDQHLKEENSASVAKFDEQEEWNIDKNINLDQSLINAKTDSVISNEFYEKYLTHTSYTDVKNLSPTRYVWNVGDAIVWDRKLLHTSENFNKNLKSKLHMVFLINFNS